MPRLVAASPPDVSQDQTVDEEGEDIHLFNAFNVLVPTRS